MGAKESGGFNKEAENLVIAAIKAPEVVNIEEIMALDAVKELKNSSKEIFNFVEFIVSSEMKTFSKDVAKHKALIEKNKMN